MRWTLDKFSSKNIKSPMFIFNLLYLQYTKLSPCLLLREEVKVTIIHNILIMFCLRGIVYIIVKETESSGRNCLMST